jgi:hypothetical protein
MSYTPNFQHKQLYAWAMHFYFEFTPQEITTIVAVPIKQVTDGIALVQAYRKRNKAKFADIIMEHPFLYRLECARLRQRAEEKTKNVPRYFAHTEKPLYL